MSKAKNRSLVFRLGSAITIAAFGLWAIPNLFFLNITSAQTSVPPVTPVTPVTPVPVPCIFPVDPVPSGLLGRPNAPFPAADHRFIHSSTSLQGVRAKVKYAGGLLYTPTSSVPEFSGFTSAVVVDNPDPSIPAVVRIDYIDNTGTNVGTSFPPPIQPEGFHVEAATPLGATTGIGSAVITQLSGGDGIVGSVLLHTECVGSVCDQDLPLSLNGQHVGASSTQQLQINQKARELWWGPLPLTNVSPIDFFNGEAPFFWVVNPNPVPNKIRVDLIPFNRATGTVGATFTWRTITLPRDGTLFEKSGTHLPPGSPGLWDAFINAYLTAPGMDFDIMVHIVSEDNLPILGDGVMTDFFGDDDPAPFNDVACNDSCNLNPGKRFDMASTMLAPTPAYRLTNPDLSYEVNGIVRTNMGIFNAGTSTVGPINIQYFDGNGNLVSTGTIANLLPGESRRIHPGAGPGINYPSSTVGFGWVRFTPCQGNARLVGWHAREILESPPEPHYHKVYADGMVGNGGREPGPGFVITDSSGQTWRRKVMPLVRTTPSFYWPGYTTFVNDFSSNIGPYWFRFFNSGGGTCTNPAGQPFAGVPWARTSTTYEDPQSVCNGNLSGRVDRTTGGIEGIHVLGDPFDEFGIPGFAIHSVPEHPPNINFDNPLIHIITRQ